MFHNLTQHFETMDSTFFSDANRRRAELTAVARSSRSGTGLTQLVTGERSSWGQHTQKRCTTRGDGQQRMLGRRSRDGDNAQGRCEAQWRPAAVGRWQRNGDRRDGT
jgi:hypothetical protein